MLSKLSDRQEAILKSIVGAYIEQAVPVPSEAIAHAYQLRVSPATVRHEMAYLEGEGYISRSHISAGAQPADKGYRYYVEALLEQETLPPDEQRLVYHLFHQVAREMDEWLHLTASMLARMAHNVALVTPPHASSCRFRHIELVGLQDLLAMAVLIVRQAKVKQQLLPLKRATSQPELSRLAEHLNSVFYDLTRSEISKSLDRGLAQEGQGCGMGGEVAAGGAPPLMEQVIGAVMRMMEKEDMETEESWYLEGLNLMLEQPEFAQGQKMRSVMEVVGERRVLRESVQQALTERGVKVIIGGENEVERMRDYSLVVTGYGVAGEASGILGVLGPTRMRYGRVIATVSYLSLLLSHLLADVYGNKEKLMKGEG